MNLKKILYRITGFLAVLTCVISFITFIADDNPKLAGQQFAYGLMITFVFGIISRFVDKNKKDKD